VRLPEREIPRKSVRVGWKEVCFNGWGIEREDVVEWVVLCKWTCAGEVDVERIYVELEEMLRDVISE